MFHPHFDVIDWLNRLLVNPDGKPDLTPINDLNGLGSDSPVGILVREHYQNLALSKGIDLGRRVPVDQFVFGRGEPPQRHLTKVHGLPYRPKDLEWPKDDSGRPLTFLAQYSFVDSRDHIGSLPGDVLLIFIRNMYVEPYPGISLEFEWYPMGLEDLIMEVPTPELVFPTCYGVRHRSWDYQEESKAISGISPFITPDFSPDEKKRLDLTLQLLICYPGMKIGGVPFWYYPSKISDDIKNRKGFLGGFCGVKPISGFPFPFVNESKSLDFEQWISNKNRLYFYDGLILNFYLEQDGSVTYEGQLL